MAAGYCEFINAIEAKRKIALDVNPDVKKYAGPGVEVINSPSTDMRAIPDGSVDVVFTSNFFEHISKPDIVATLKEVHRILKDNGALLVLQPNIRYAHKDYWMFFDHVTPIDDRSLVEVLELNGFEVRECRPRFLPYSTKSRLPKSLGLVKLYLRFPLAQRLIGKQAFVHAVKVRGTSGQISSLKEG